MQSDLPPGLFEEVEVRLLRRSAQSLRDDLGSTEELAASISEKGLLQPIIARPMENGFEIVAGNRRLAACRSLGMRKIHCHVIELDEKEAFEVALIENIQHETLNPVEEARAIKKYVDTYGYGGESELARKIGKSEQYISQRVRLLSLPADVLTKVSRRLVTFSSAVELIGLEEQSQRVVSDLVATERVSSRSVRRLVKNIKTAEDPFSLPEDHGNNHRAYRVLGKCIGLLRTSLVRLDDIIVHLDDNEWVLRETLLAHRTTIHQQIDALIRLRTKLSKVASNFEPLTTNEERARAH